MSLNPELSSGRAETRMVRVADGLYVMGFMTREEARDLQRQYRRLPPWNRAMAAKLMTLRKRKGGPTVGRMLENPVAFKGAPREIFGGGPEAKHDTRRHFDNACVCASLRGLGCGTA